MANEESGSKQQIDEARKVLFELYKDGGIVGKSKLTKPIEQCRSSCSGHDGFCGRPSRGPGQSCYGGFLATAIGRLSAKSR